MSNFIAIEFFKQLKKKKLSSIFLFDDEFKYMNISEYERKMIMYLNTFNCIIYIIYSNQVFLEGSLPGSVRSKKSLTFPPFLTPFSGVI